MILAHFNLYLVRLWTIPFTKQLVGEAAHVCKWLEASPLSLRWVIRLSERALFCGTGALVVQRLVCGELVTYCVRLSIFELALNF